MSHSSFSPRLSQSAAPRRSRFFYGMLAAVIILTTVAFALPSFLTSAYAAQGQVGAPQVTLNPGGGIETDGSDGLRFTINSAASGGAYDSAVAGQDGVVYRATRQYCCGAGAPMLNIGGTLYGQSGPAASGGVATWTSIEVISTSGATAVGTRTSDTGNSSATVRYTVTKNSLNYLIDRTVSYTYPNDYVTDTYSFTIPTGNAEAVKFYLGGDTAPGSSDSGYGVMLTEPVRSVISLNTSSHIMYGFREIIGSKAFDGATSQSYSAPYGTVTAGGDIGFVVIGSTHDAGLMMQWNLGSTPGTQTASLQQFATQQGTNLNAGFAESTAEVGEAVQLNFSIVNTELITVDELDFTAELPSGLEVGSGSQSNSCGGTVTATTGSDTVELVDGSITAATNCVISIPVTSDDPGVYTLSADSISSLDNLTNNVGTSSLTFSDDNDEDGITNAVEDAAPNSGDANDDGTPDKNQLHVTSFVNTVATEYTTLVVDEDCELTSVTAQDQSGLAEDSGYSYPLGLLDFTADCGNPGFTTTVTQYFFNPPTESFVLRKFVNDTYQEVEDAVITTDTIGGDAVLIISYQVTDGGDLDDDGLENGIIVDPAGPAILAAISSPTPSASPTASPAAGVPNTGLPPRSMLTFAIALVLGGALLITRHFFLRRFAHAPIKKRP